MPWIICGNGRNANAAGPLTHTIPGGGVTLAFIRRHKAALAFFAASTLVALALAGCEGVKAFPDGPPETGYTMGKSAGPPDLPIEQGLRVGLIYVPGNPDETTTIGVYRQLLEEEGYPFELVEASALAFDTPQSLKEQFAALIFPEDVNRGLGAGFGRLIERYVAEAGGKVLIAYDAGTLDEAGEARSQWLFSALTGIKSLGRDASDRYLGPWVIPQASSLRAFFEDGVLSGSTAKVYAVPAVQEYHYRLEGVDSTPLAYGQEGALTSQSVIMTEKTYASGGVAIYINGRPGSLKARGNNDFMMRVPIRYFLLDVARMPRLVASPGGVGGLAVSIHICSGVYFKDLDRIFRENTLSREIPFSFSITAGPDSDRPGDGGGFDAANPEKGLPYLASLAQYGSIGAQGGWIHNYWAYHFNELSKDAKKKYIDDNFQVLGKLSGTPVTEYAAPGGVHSVDVNDAIAAQGVRGASIPTSFCAPPTRGWFDGKKEDRFWLFGYTGTQYGMALENMLAGGRQPEDIEDDLGSIVDTVVDRREIRLFYSHPISIAAHPDMWEAIQGYVLEKVHSGDLTVRTVAEFAEFLDRREKVSFSVERFQNGYRIHAESAESMRDMAFAVPIAPGTRVKDSQGFPVRQRDGWAYVTIDQDLMQADIRLTLGN